MERGYGIRHQPAFLHVSQRDGLQSCHLTKGLGQAAYHPPRSPEGKSGIRVSVAG